MNQRIEQRALLRAERRRLSAAAQAEAARRLCANVTRLRAFQASKRIAAYLPNDGEIDPQPILAHAQHMGKHCYLPVLSPAFHDRLWFAPLHPDARFVTNRFGIPEPAVHPAELLDARELDLIFLPLVAFDVRGNRLGMGGGFYDRSLAFLHLRRVWRKPRLIGLAHDFQRVGALPAQPWDVPLQATATDRGIYSFETGV